MSKILTKSNNYLSVFEDYLIKISGISLFVVMILTSFQIISRVLGYPWPGYLELSELSISIFAFLGVAYAQRLDAHIRMELLVGNLKGFPLFVDPKKVPPCLKRYPPKVLWFNSTAATGLCIKPAVPSLIPKTSILYLFFAR